MEKEGKKFEVVRRDSHVRVFAKFEIGGIGYTCRVNYKFLLLNENLFLLL